MVIEIISPNTIKVVLDKEDMSSYNLSFDELDRSSPETKNLLIDLIENIKNEKDIDISNDRLFVEAFPKSDGGCLLYLSMLNAPSKNTAEKSNSLYNSIICSVNSPDILIKISDKLFSMFNHILHDSELYYLEGNFILILHTFKKADKRIRTFLSEFCEITGDDDIDLYTVREYFNCIFPVNAIEEINKKTYHFFKK